MIKNNFHEIYTKVLTRVLDEGQLIAKTKFIPNIHFELTDPTHCLISHRKNWHWALQEGINRMSITDAELQNPGTAYNVRPNWKKKLDKEDGKFIYSYGEEYSTQIPLLLKSLKSASEREAILTMWKSEYTLPSLKKVMPRRPCTLNLHFFRMHNVLHCACYMRTVDIMNMLPYDIFHHTLLQRVLATELSLDLGSFYFTASFGYYQKKRDVSGSVKSTLNVMRNSLPPNVSEDWRMSLKEIRYIGEFLKKFYLEGDYHSVSNIAYMDHQFSYSYFQALIYCINKSQKIKSTHDIDLNEFNIVKY